jgi:hypothetical protein
MCSRSRYWDNKIVAMIGKKNEYGKLGFWESVNLKV